MKAFTTVLVLALLAAFASAQFMSAYTDCSGSGTEYKLPIPGPFTYDDISVLGLNDRLNFFKLPAGFSIKLWAGHIDDNNHPSATYQAGNICLDNTNLKNAVSSWVVTPNTPQTAVVEAFEGCSGTGQKWTFKAPLVVPFQSIQAVGANDRINFIRVPEGFTATLFEHHLNQGAKLELAAGSHCLVGTVMQSKLSSFYTTPVAQPQPQPQPQPSTQEKFERTHDELKGVYKLLSDLEAKLAAQLTAANNNVAQKAEALKAAQQSQAQAQAAFDTALAALNQAKQRTDAAQGALNAATSDRNGLADTIRKELALIKKLKEILGHHHCDDLVLGDNCFKVVKASVNFKAVADACTAWGGFPASVENAQENEFIRQRIGGCGAAWLGGTDLGTEGQWRWFDGTRWAYTNWAPGEPNNVKGGSDARFVNGENHLEMYEDGRWNDIPDVFEGRANCYVCKK